MADKNQSEGNVDPVTTGAAEGKQPEPMPSSQPEPVEVPEGDDLTLPEDVSERTKQQFAKLKDQLKEAKEQARVVEQPTPQEPFGTSVFDFFPNQSQPVQQAPYVQPYVQPPAPALNPQQVDQIRRQYVDQYGNVDVEGFNQALIGANRQAQAAEERARQAEEAARRAHESVARFEEAQQLRQAYTDHPELDPLNKGAFDREFSRLVRNELLANIAMGRERRNDPNYVAEVAAAVKRVYKSPTTSEAKVKEKAVEEYKKAQDDKKSQGPIEQGRGADRSTGDISDLRRRTRAGDKSVLNSRLNDYFKSQKAK